MIHLVLVNDTIRFADYTKHVMNQICYKVF